jgi:hypothetical protein
MDTECLKWGVFMGRRYEIYRTILGLILGEKVIKLKSRAFGRRVSEIWSTNEQFGRIYFSY